jgi:phosphatidylglycerol:prolipoprotein diacylglycerol transferase
MHPLLEFSFGAFAWHVQSYGFFLTLAAVVTAVGGWVMATRRGLPLQRTLIVLAATVVAGLVGARLLHAATHWAAYRVEPWHLFTLDPNGLALFGGLFAAALVGWAACRLARLDPWRLADSIAVPLGFGIALARVGCFLNGCCFGKTTIMPWGVTFPPFSEVHLYQLSQGAGAGLFSVAPVHPTQLYDAAAAVSGALIAGWILRRRLPRGVAIAAFVAWYALGRSLIQPFRVVMPSEDAPTWFYPALFLTVAAASAVVAWRRSLAADTNQTKVRVPWARTARTRPLVRPIIKKPL